MTMMNHKMMSTVRPPIQEERSERTESVTLAAALKVIRCNVRAPAAMEWVIAEAGRRTSRANDIDPFPRGGPCPDRVAETVRRLNRVAPKLRHQRRMRSTRRSFARGNQATSRLAKPPGRCC